MLKRLISLILALALCTYIYHPGRHASNYSYIKDTAVVSQLVTTKHRKNETNLKDCDYQTIILNNEEIDISSIYRTHQYKTPLQGGEYIPEECNPLFKIAILICYRDRQEQLGIFLNYMHSFLQKQRLHYRIFVAEQNDDKPFNRAKMFNYAAMVAIEQKYDCLILSDVDLLPITSGNIYACAYNPRHMSSALDTFRFNLPYLGLFGGVISIQAEQFERVNGMSNIYDGWGGEDDDFFTRLADHNLFPCRFSPELSKYTMLKHKKQIPNAERFKYLKSSLKRQKVDGLNSLNRNFTVKLERLYTHIYVS